MSLKEQNDRPFRCAEFSRMEHPRGKVPEVLRYVGAREVSKAGR